MKSLKEQREKLLQAKLEEMADIGVKKRTEENTPDFDDPIDLDDDSDSVEEDASASLSNRRKYRKKLRLMTPMPKQRSPRKEREMPERRILPQQWTFLNTNSDF